MCLALGQGRAQSAPQIPDANGLTILVRTTIIALNHANRTGNYTVFRDLGTPGFQKANTAAKLAEIFANLRKLDLDFRSIVLFNPQFTKKPALNNQRMLRLTGFFATSPLRVHFDLAYEWIENRWLLFGIAVQTRQAPVAAKKP
jgi:hypothetical protein